MNDAQAMQLALVQAGIAAAAGEVPVGAVVLKDGVLIATGRNAPIAAHDPTAHAEIVALRAAALAVGNYRLEDCELFVTLEPCAMCVGAMLHARLKRVVFGAAEPKTGAAGSVVNLFALDQLNHQTLVQGGIMAEEGAALLQHFFKHKRTQMRFHCSPLRDDAVRTPDSRFAALPDFPWQAHYLSDLPTLTGLRLHYLDLGPTDAPLTYLCLHGPATWSYLFRAMLPGLLAEGARVVVPDLIGFGKSDKPKKETFHQIDWHRQVLSELIERLRLANIVWILPNGDDLLELTQIHAVRCGDVRLLDITYDPLDAAYAAPYPDRGHRAALRAFGRLTTGLPTPAGQNRSPGSAPSR